MDETLEVGVVGVVWRQNIQDGLQGVRYASIIWTSPSPRPPCCDNQYRYLSE
jgi:hypothetical protein